MNEMTAILLKSFGESDVLFLGKAEKPSPKPGELLVKVKSAALNRADILQRQGRYPPPPKESQILGLEIAGIVESVGEGVDSSKFRVGDRVFGLVGGGAYAEYCVMASGMALHIPETMSFEEAAAIPEAFFDSLSSTFLVGRTFVE
jgi:NADPH:quinone reductase-like Zn-dependent oxidoreductase